MQRLMATFQAVWPVLNVLRMPASLYAEARKDLPAVAARHNARITGEPQFAIHLGKLVPGSQNAEYVVTATAPAEAVRHRNYGQPHPLGELPESNAA